MYSFITYSYQQKTYVLIFIRSMGSKLPFAPLYFLILLAPEVVSFTTFSDARRLSGMLCCCTLYPPAHQQTAAASHHPHRATCTCAVAPITTTSVQIPGAAGTGHHFKPDTGGSTTSTSSYCHRVGVYQQHDAWCDVTSSLYDVTSS